nr:phi PVL orf 51-like protein [Staphylococcus aureus]
MAHIHVVNGTYYFHVISCQVGKCEKTFDTAEELETYIKQSDWNMRNRSN